MSREIKFRVWDEDNNTIGTVLSFTNLENLRHDLDGIEDYFGRGYFKDNPNYLMQFTGLKDNNGVDIYEGDKLSYTIFDHNDNDKQYTGVVKWFGSGFIVTQIPDDQGNGEYGIELFWIHNQDCEIEVTGYIHENKN
jgi:uncharacterized phage protein (TIGR01671 family)